MPCDSSPASRPSHGVWAAGKNGTLQPCNSRVRKWGATVARFVTRGALMRALFLALSAAVSAQATPSAAQQYRVVAQLPAGDGGWDLLSVDPVDQRLYVGRPDGVTAIDIRTGKATE